MIDPFYAPKSSSQNHLRALELVDDATELDAVNQKMSRLSKMLLIYSQDACAPLATFKAITLAATHVTLLNADTRGTFPALIEALHHPMMIRSSAPTSRASAKLMLGELFMAALSAALNDANRLKSTDIPDIITMSEGSPMNPLLTPARAEMFQHLSSSWDAMNESMGNSPTNKIYAGTSATDLSSPDTKRAHYSLLPILLPQDRAIRMPPNHSYGRYSETFYNYAGIPLAWTWDPTAMHTNKESRFRMHGGAGYEANYDPGEHSELLYSSGAFRVSCQGRDNKDLPRWAYAMLRVPADSGPTHNESTYQPVSGYTPTRPSQTGYGPFRHTAALWLARKINQLALGAVSAHEFHVSADAPLLARHIDAWLDMSEGSFETYWLDHAEYRDDLGEAFTDMHDSVKKTWRGNTPPYGQYSALLSGVRYLPLAWRSGHMTRSMQRWDPEIWAYSPVTDAGRLLPPTTERLKRAGRWINHDRTTASLSQHTVGYHAWYKDGEITKKDMTVARLMILPGATRCVKDMIEGALQGRHGDDVKRWVESALNTALSFVAVQEEIIISDPKAYSPALVEIARSRVLTKITAGGWMNQMGENAEYLSSIRAVYTNNLHTEVPSGA